MASWKFSCSFKHIWKAPRLLVRSAGDCGGVWRWLGAPRGPSCLRLVQEMTQVNAVMGLRAFRKGFGGFLLLLEHLELGPILLLSGGGSSWEVPQLQGSAAAQLTIQTSFSFLLKPS